MASSTTRELEKRTEGTKEVTSDELYVKERSYYSGKVHYGESSRFKSKGRNGKLKSFLCHSKGHLKRDCLMKKSSGFVKKGKHDQDFDSSDDEGNAYFGEALVVVENDEMTELVTNSGGSYHMTHKRDFLYDFKVTDDGSVQLVDKRVWFEVEVHGAQGNRETEVFQVSNDDAAVAQRWLEDKQIKEKTSMDCLVKEQEKVHLSIKVGASIMVTEVSGKDDAEGNVAKKKKVKESMKANLGKLLKYNA
nr:zinc finger, CCHC-type [Tanacetum cinerariifolium]